MRYVLFQLFLALATLLLQIVEPAPLSLTCSLCVCTGDRISCRGVGLTSMPRIDSSSFNVYHHLDLSHNYIGNVHQNDFNNLYQLKELDLSDNYLTHIDRHAFTHIANISFLNLSTNSLTSLPDALLDLHSLETLDVTSNPIPDNPVTGFTDAVMRHLGTKLKEFHFGGDTINTWPVSTNHLQALEVLELNGSHIYYVPPYFMDGFKSRLISLTIRNTNLPTTPIMTGLRNLRELHLDNNPFHNYGILPNSFTGLDSLTILSLRSDQLTEFPPILELLPRLTSVSLDGNSFYYISDNAITLINRTRISELSLRNCHLDRVPGSLTGASLRQLTSIDLSNNNINSIERYDLKDLVNLHKLSFAHNPLEYVSEEALKFQSLATLDLSDTKLKTIPRAVQNIPNLRELLLTNNEIDCTCDLIWFEKLLKARHGALNVTGSCETIYRTVVQYLDQFIPKCPDYVP